MECDVFLEILRHMEGNPICFEFDLGDEEPRGVRAEEELQLQNFGHPIGYGDSNPAGCFERVRRIVVVDFSPRECHPVVGKGHRGRGKRLERETVLFFI